MEQYLSKKFIGINSNAVREILKMVQDPKVISFAAGSPASEALPFEKIAEYANRVLTEYPVKALQYGVSEGDGDLLWLVRHKLIEEDLFKNDEEVMMISGAQQGLDFAARCLCEEGDTVLCEDPTFVGALNSFRSYGLRTVGVPMNHDGMDLNILEEKLKSEKNVRFIYTIPNFQNPTGITMSFEKRRAMIELAQKYNVVILEDNPYGALRFSGEEVPSIKSFDTEGRVIYLGSFSKILSPGLRVGFIVADKTFMKAFVLAKQCADVQDSGLSQQICKLFLEETDMRDHYQRLSAIYKDRCTYMQGEMNTYFGDEILRTDPQGGLFIWCTLPKWVNMYDFVKRAIGEHSVAVVPGNAFEVTSNSKSCDNNFRVNYSSPTKEQITIGIKGLADTLKAMNSFSA